MTKNLTLNKPSLLQVESKRKFNLNVNVTRYTTDGNGTILDDAVIPASQKIPFPFHMFGEFDRNGGYRIADGMVNSVYRTILFAVYPSWGVNTPLFFFNALANINNVFKKGDTIFVYVDDLLAPTYFTFVIISAQQGAYASIVSQLNTTQLSGDIWGTFKIFDCQYTWLNDNQLDQAIYIIQTQFDTGFRSDPLVPRAYYHPEYKPGVNKTIIPIEMIANQFAGLSSFLTYENSLLNLSFTVYA